MTEPMDSLLYHWGDEYVITLTADGVFHALPKTGASAAELTAATADELRLLIRADYQKRTAK